MGIDGKQHESRMSPQVRAEIVQSDMKIFFNIEYARNGDWQQENFYLFDFCVLQFQNPLAIIHASI